MPDTRSDIPSDIPSEQPLKVIIGAGEQHWDGWIPTQQADLDLLSRASFERYFGQDGPGQQADAFLCEHVWEHLTEAQGREAARICYDFLKPGGWLRVAVPDRFFPDSEYQRMVQVGGPGPADHPAADHQVVYDAQQLRAVFEAAGFEVDLLEYCGPDGRFHYHQWEMASGPIYRSLLGDHRNNPPEQKGKLGFVSIILDAKKPA